MSVGPAIALDGLEVGHGRAPVLRIEHATALGGRITAVVGPNASGKSTLLRTVSGALPPLAGSVRVHGRDPRRLHGRALAETIAYVAQRPTLAARFLVREVVALGRHALPSSSARIDAALEAVGAATIAERPFDAISVGQQQRVMLARALAQSEARSVLLLDEPTSAMDLRAAQCAMSAVRAAVSRGAAALVAAHDLHAVRGWADDAWLLAEGRLVAAGPAAEVLAPAPLAAAFGVPFVRIALPDGGETVLPAPPPSDR